MQSDGPLHTVSDVAEKWPEPMHDRRGRGHAPHRAAIVVIGVCLVRRSHAASNCTGPLWRCMMPEVLAANMAMIKSIDHENANGVVQCSEVGRKSKCCGDDVCDGPETVANCLADCPGVTTDATCGEEPHSDRGGKTLTFGVGHRATSAQDCCDKCKARTPCNSWTFCGLPVCWGLDSGWNHTFGECWLRVVEDASKLNVTFGQRGRLSATFRAKHANVRPTCALNRTWHACPPTHVPWTSGSLGGPAVDRSDRFTTGGGWGKIKWAREGEPLDEL